MTKDTISGTRFQARGAYNFFFFFCDINLAIKLAKTPIHHEKTKIVGVDCHFIREKIEENEGVLA